MMNWLSSGTSFIIQVILVVAGVLVFAFFDPFDILVSNKLTIQDTPAHVKKIRAIGELITAEFYGEVLSSYQTLVEVTKEDEIDRMKREIREMDSSFKVRVYALLSVEKQGEQRRQFNAIMDEFSQNSYFDSYRKRLNAVMKVTFFNTLFRKLVIESGIESLGDDPVYLNDVFADAEKQIKKEYTSAKIRKPQLIMLGRGKVSAGFRFDKLDEHNIRVDSGRNRIVLIGMTAEVLSCDINPWLVPELGIKGFEIVDVNRKADNPAILQRVKQACLDSLMAQALGSDILAIAKTNAEQNLKEFFSLILNNPAIEVKIESDELDYYSKYVVCDSVIDPSQLAAMERLVNARYASGQQDSVKISELLDSLAKCQLAVGTNRYAITPFTMPIYRWLKRNMLKTATDTTQLRISVDSVRNGVQRNGDNFSKLFGAALLRKNKLPGYDTVPLLNTELKTMSMGFLRKN
jgi:hypothetical protein